MLAGRSCCAPQARRHRRALPRRSISTAQRQSAAARPQSAALRATRGCCAARAAGAPATPKQRGRPTPLSKSRTGSSFCAWCSLMFISKKTGDSFMAITCAAYTRKRVHLERMAAQAIDTGAGRAVRAGAPADGHGCLSHAPPSQSRTSPPRPGAQTSACLDGQCKPQRSAATVRRRATEYRRAGVHCSSFFDMNASSSTVAPLPST